jgi:starch phosphorylase
MAKTIIRLITAVAAVVNNDKDIGDLLKVVFIEDYNVSKAEIIIPASDISEHISTAGTEASGTSNMKFVLNGGLIIGTVDGANVEIVDEIGDQNAFTFGHLAENVPDLRHKHHFATPRPELDANLAIVFKEIQINTFGNAELFEPLLNSIEEGGDYYLVSDDFGSYLDAQKLVDELYVSKDAWAERSILAVARMGHFSSDRTIVEYAEQIWNIEPVPIK